MRIFSNFEDAVENFVNRMFSRTFKSSLKPVDFTSAIKKEMEDHAQPLGDDRAIAPNHFTFNLSQTDLDHMQDQLDFYQEEFQRQATEFAVEKNLVLIGPVQVDFVPSDAELTGQLTLHSQSKRASAAPAPHSIVASPTHPIIEINGERWLLTEPVVVIGRSSDADIMVADSGVSRRHLELRVTPTGVIATDLGSTNGTYVEGHRIDAATLQDGNEISIGRTRIMFWMSPADDDPSAFHTEDW